MKDTNLNQANLFHNFKPVKNSRNSKNEWLSAYLNTKFYNVPNNIKISCSRFTKGTGVTNIIKGHEYGLGLDFNKQDEVQLTKTKVKIFYRENISTFGS